MTKTKPASLAAVFAAKGEAKPADATKPIDAPEVVPVAQNPPQAAHIAETPKVTEPSSSEQAEPTVVVQSANMPLATKSLTVKVDVATYGKLKAHGGALGGKTNQDIFIEALGLYFNKHKIK